MAARLKRRLPLESLPALAMLLVVACVGPGVGTTAQTENPRLGGNPVTSDTTAFTTSPMRAAEAIEWPTVRAASFVHRPSGAVFGVPTDFPDPIFCGRCALTTLDDGRVLLIGTGHSIGYAAWIWEPESGQWMATGAPNSEWDGYGSADAVLLGDGRVLVTSGTVPATAGSGFSQIEVYDPAEGSFRLLEPPGLIDQPLVHGIDPVVMADGRVLLAASLGGGFVFEPADESLSPVGVSRTEYDYVPLAVALADGRVLLLAEAGASVYDPETGEFMRVEPAYPTGGAAPALLKDGRVLVTGGETWHYSQGGNPEDLGSRSAQVFDPTKDRFTAVGSMLAPRSHHLAATLADGRVVIMGADGHVEEFDPETATFQRAPSLTRPRRGASMTMLDDGSIFVVGGRAEPSIGWMGLDADWTTFRTAEIYHPHQRRAQPSATGLNGFTLAVDFDFVEEEVETPSGEISLNLVVPPGGLRGVTYAHAMWATAPSLVDSPGSMAWIRPDGRVWGWGDDSKPLPADCEQGCEIRQLLSAKLPSTTAKLGVLFHLQYQGDIPPEAQQITLTLDEGT